MSQPPSPKRTSLTHTTATIPPSSLPSESTSAPHCTDNARIQSCAELLRLHAPPPPPSPQQPSTLLATKPVNLLQHSASCPTSPIATSPPPPTLHLQWQ
jgi:hypothetical protein